MIELIDNIIQMGLAGVVFSIAFFRAFVKIGQDGEGSREYTLIGLFAFEYFIGDLYSILYLLVYETTSQNFYISELCWYTAYLFMILLLIQMSGDRPFAMESRLQVLIPVFTVVMAVVFYVRNGDLAGNLISVVIMSVAIWLAVNGLIRENRKGASSDKKPFYMICLALIALEYAMWISSSLYWPGDTLGNPYFWIDAVFSVFLVGLMHSAGKAVGR